MKIRKMFGRLFKAIKEGIEENEKFYREHPEIHAHQQMMEDMIWR